MTNAEFLSRDQILLIEDDEMQREVLAVTLQDFGYSVQKVSNAEKALDYLSTAKNLRCVISDIQLWKLTGIDFCKASRDKHLDVIFIAISSNSEYRIPALDAGFDVFIQKPVTKTRLARFLCG